ncbi:MAG: hypothetical protein K2G25_02960 [Oscillospiraceae bacterium]|nr:hypothetical protein [Oscillospiraceae bacterium]
MKMLNALIEIMNHHQMVSIYGDSTDWFFTGYIQAVDETGLLLSKQNYGGYSNGFVFFTDIMQFETDSPDTERHEKLFRLRKILPDKFEIVSNDNLLEAVLKICFEKRLFCDFFKNEEDETDRIGFISELHENDIIITNIDAYGAYAGKIYLQKSDIYRLFIEGEQEQARKLLYYDNLDIKANPDEIS